MFGVEGRTDPAVPAGLVLAPLGRRLGGLLLDQLIILAPIVLVAFALGLQPGSQISAASVFAISVASIAVSFVYFTLMIGFLGRTVGKMAAGVRVVRADDGEPVGWTAAVMRALLPLVLGAVPSIGFALTLGVYSFAVFSPLRQGLHDRAAGTLVVMQRRSSSAAVPPGSFGPPGASGPR
jgi:uncharacterized RDD family membrane protein YckC